MELLLHLTGTEPLLMHSAELADPLNPKTKALAEITSKKTMTDEDRREAADREWLGGLYWADGGPYIPGVNIERALLDSARMVRKGKTIERGVFVTTNYCTLKHPGPAGIEALRDHPDYRLTSSVRIGMRRVQRTRPQFRVWSTAAEVSIDEEVINLADFRAIAANAGRLIGLGDWRPRFGRFTAQVETL